MEILDPRGSSRRSISISDQQYQTCGDFYPEMNPSSNAMIFGKQRPTDSIQENDVASGTLDQQDVSFADARDPVKTYEKFEDKIRLIRKIESSMIDKDLSLSRNQKVLLLKNSKIDKCFSNKNSGKYRSVLAQSPSSPSKGLKIPFLQKKILPSEKQNKKSGYTKTPDRAAGHVVKSKLAEYCRPIHRKGVISRFTRKIPLETHAETPETMQWIVEQRNGELGSFDHEIPCDDSFEMNSLRIWGGAEQQYNIIMEDPKEYENSKC